MRIFLIVLISSLSLLSSCKETPPAPPAPPPAVETGSDVKQELNKLDKPVKEFKEKVAELGDAQDPKNKKRATEIINLAQDLKAQITKAENDLIAKRKANGISDKPGEFKLLRDEISVDEEKAITILSRIMEPELARLAKENDAKLATQLELIENLKVSEKVTGLKNCGNTCFMNSVFQSLFHTPELNRLLQVPLKDIPLAKDISKDANLIKILQEAFEDYRTTAQDAIDTNKLVSTRRTYFPNFGEGQQGDAQEFLNSFIGRLGEELNVAKKLKLVVSDEYKDRFGFIENYNKAGGSQYSLVNRWFGGYLKNVLKKKDGQTSTSYDPFNVLSLKFPNDTKGPFKLDKLYEFFSQPEDLGDFSKTLSVQKAPQNLIVQLSRFIYDNEGNSKKIDAKVDYPLEWTLKTEDGDVKYELYAVSLHSGSLSGGHYWADIKAGNNWFNANDSTISATTAKEVIGDNNQSNAYLLFYRKK